MRNQGKSKKTRQLKLLIGASVALVLIGAASAARADEAVAANVPFTFIVGDSQLPPGHYVVRDASDNPGVVSIASADGRRTVFVLTIASSSEDTPSQPELVFERVGDAHFLAGIVRPDGNDRALVLTPAIEQRQLVKVAAHAESEAGSSR
jgi:hypothetical protein